MSFNAQTFYVGDNAQFYVGDGSTFFVNGDALVEGDSAFVTNHGNLYLQNDGVASGTLELNDSANLDGNGQYFLDGNWINNAKFSSDSSHVHLEGSDQLISGDSVSIFFDLSLTGTGVKRLMVNSGANQTLDLTDRELATDSFIFDVFWEDVDAISWTSGFVSSLDSGYLSRSLTGSNVYVYPVGSNIGTFRYRPASMTLVTSTVDFDRLGVRFANVDPTIEGYDRSIKDSTICTVNPDYYHRITRIEGTNAIDMELTYDNVQDFTPQTIAHWNSDSNWNDIEPVIITQNNSPTLSIGSRSVWNDFNSIAFAFATSGFDISKQVVDISCFGANDGEASVSLSDTTGDATISWTPGGINDSIFNLGAGTYYVEVSDTFGCVKTDSVMIIEPSQMVMADTASDVACNGDTTGFIYVNVSGGIPGYDYNWSNGAITDSLTNVGAGVYYVTITDNNSCELRDTFQLTQPNPLAALTGAQRPLCYGDSNGTANIQVFGGIEPYSYQWDANANSQDSSLATDLPAGLYSVEITDSNNCVSTFNINVQNPDSLESEMLSDVDAGCGMSNGEAEVIADGGTGSLGYEWSDLSGQTSTTATGLPGGLYYVTITDQNNCERIDSIMVDIDYSVGGPLVNIDTSGTTCDVSGDGVATITPTSGIAPYLYEWDPNTGGQDSSTAVNLDVGTYSVTVTDSNGCYTDTMVIIINDDTPPFAQLDVTPPSCYQYEDAMIEASTSEGVPPYIYTWNTGETTDSISDLAPGIYYVDIIDDVGCSFTDTIEVPDAPSMLPQISGNSYVCYGDSINLLAQGSEQVIGYEWSTGEITDNIVVDPLMDSVYTVTVTNGNCFEEDSFFVEVKALPEISFVGDSGLCDSGSIELAAIADVETYLWNTGDTTSAIQIEAITSLSSYTVTVTDSLGCINSNDSEPFTVTIYPKPVAGYDTALVGWFAQDITFIDSSTSDVNQWLWHFGDGDESTVQNPLHQYEDVGEFEIMLVVTNEFGCIDTTTGLVYIEESIQIPNVFSPNGDGLNDYFTIPFVGKEYEIVIHNRWGQELFRSQSDRIIWDGRTMSGTIAPEGTYYYVLTAVGSKEDYSTSGYFTLVR